MDKARDKAIMYEIWWSGRVYKQERYVWLMREIWVGGKGDEWLREMDCCERKER
jgi:hypothetical protein